MLGLPGDTEVTARLSASILDDFASFDIGGAISHIARFIDTGPGYLVTVVVLFLLWAAWRSFLR